MEGQDCCNEKPNTITEECIEGCIESCEFIKLGNKTTCCLLTLRNGFEICATSACVDPNNYDHDIGCKLARQRAVDKVWELEGYKLQCGMPGAC